MFVWVLMDVYHQPDQVGIGGDFHAAKRMFKEAAGAVVGLVDRFCIGVEEVSKLGHN